MNFKYNVKKTENIKIIGANTLDNTSKFTGKAMVYSKSRPKYSVEFIDFITVAQAFHWFDGEGFKKECKRIGKLDSKVILIWNSRVSSSNLIKENAQICKKYCPNFKGFSGGMENPDDHIRQFFDNQYEKLRFENNLKFDKIRFIERNLSASYSLKETDEGYKDYIFELERLFDKYASDDSLIMENDTVAYIGKV